jgi:hypothetical protein
MRKGLVALGAAALATLGIVVATRKPAAAEQPSGLVSQYLAEIAAATTHAQLDAIRYRFEADLSAMPPLLTYDQYTVLYNAYARRYLQVTS